MGTALAAGGGGGSILGSLASAALNRTKAGKVLNLVGALSGSGTPTEGGAPIQASTGGNIISPTEPSYQAPGTTEPSLTRMPDVAYEPPPAEGVVGKSPEQINKELEASKKREAAIKSTIGDLMSGNQQPEPERESFKFQNIPLNTLAKARTPQWGQDFRYKF